MRLTRLPIEGAVAGASPDRRPDGLSFLLRLDFVPPVSETSRTLRVGRLAGSCRDATVEFETDEQPEVDRHRAESAQSWGTGTGTRTGTADSCAELLTQVSVTSGAGLTCSYTLDTPSRTSFLSDLHIWTHTRVNEVLCAPICSCVKAGSGRSQGGGERRHHGLISPSGICQTKFL